MSFKKNPYLINAKRSVLTTCKIHWSKCKLKWMRFIYAVTCMVSENCFVVMEKSGNFFYPDGWQPWSLFPGFLQSYLLFYGYSNRLCTTVVVCSSLTFTIKIASLYNEFVKAVIEKTWTLCPHKGHKPWPNGLTSRLKLFGHPMHVPTQVLVLQTCVDLYQLASLFGQGFSINCVCFACCLHVCA